MTSGSSPTGFGAGPFPAALLEERDARDARGRHRPRREDACGLARQHGCLPVDAAQARPVHEDIVDIGLRLGDARHEPATDAARPGIVCGKRQMIMAEPVELLAKISRSAAQIILDAIAVHSQRGSRPDRKSTRLNSITNAHLVCRLLLEK